MLELRIGVRLDAGDAFEDTLEENAVIGGAGVEARLEILIVDGEALAGLGQRIVVEAGRMIGASSGVRRARSSLVKKAAIAPPPVFDAPPASQSSPMRWL